MNLETRYPKLFEKLEEREVELRHLLNVDENYEDFDSEEYEFDHEEYNYVIYIAEPVQKVLGEQGMEALVQRLGEHQAFENFIASEMDLYGVKSDLYSDEIAWLVLDHVEGLA